MKNYFFMLDNYCARGLTGNWKSSFIIFTFLPIIIELPFVVLCYYNLMYLSLATYLFYFLILSTFIIQSLKIFNLKVNWATKVFIECGLLVAVVFEFFLYMMIFGMIAISQSGLAGIQ